MLYFFGGHIIGGKYSLTLLKGSKPSATRTNAVLVAQMLYNCSNVFSRDIFL